MRYVPHILALNEIEWAIELIKWAWAQGGTSSIESILTAFWGWIWGMVSGWIAYVFDPVKLLSSAGAGVALFFNYVAALLPEGAETALVSFTTWLQGDVALNIVKIAVWVLDQFTVASVVVGLLACRVAVFPVAVLIRFGFWLLHKFWGSNG